MMKVREDAGRRIRACLGALWLLDAALQARPQCFRFEWWHDDLAESVMGQPEAVSRSILWATTHLAPHAALVNGLAVALQAVIGLCLIFGRFERAAIAASIPWALGIWWVGEGFGSLATGLGLLAGGAPGPVVLYALVGILCWPGPGDERRIGGLPGRLGAARWAWVGLWCGGAVAGLPWCFPAGRIIQANIEQNGLGQPGWLEAISRGSYRIAGSHPVVLSSALFALQVAVGLGVLSIRSRRMALVAGCGLAVVFWLTVQDLGGLASGTATDPGSGPLLVLLAVTVASADWRRAGHPNWRPQRIPLR